MAKIKVTPHEDKQTMISEMIMPDYALRSIEYTPIIYDCIVCGNSLDLDSCEKFICNNCRKAILAYKRSHRKRGWKK